MSGQFPLFPFLNSAQLRAVTAPEGHLLINAAAGTGKTTTVAARILYLQVERGLPPSAILGVTFSRAARTQILERLERLCTVAGRGSPVRIYTFHGLAFRVVRLAAELGETWLRPGFLVIAAGRNQPNPLFTENAWELFRGSGGAAALILYSRAIDLLRQGHAQIGRALARPADLPRGSSIRVPGDFGERVDIATDDIRRVWERYEDLLRRHNAIDYPGLVTEAIRALAHPSGSTLDRVQDGLRYLVVDEYQDTSRAQEQLMLGVAGSRVYINAVGDNDQAIYTFNGSDVSNILNFAERVQHTGLPLLEPVHLTENYRSSPNILLLANRILAKSHRPLPKQLQPSVDPLPEPLQGYRERNYEVCQVDAPRLDLAADFVAREVHRLITEEGVQPGEIAVLVRKDTEHSPQGASVREALAGIGVETTTPDREPQQKAAVIEATRELCQYHYGEPLTGLMARVAAGDCDAELNGARRDEVLGALEEALRAGAQVAYQAAEFLYDAGVAESEVPDAGGVHVRTIHSAKGAEFRIVFLMYLADRAFPHGARPDEDEERRLLYVGITRAQERLYVVGHNGIHGPDFFGDCFGEGVRRLDASVRGGGPPPPPPPPALDEDTLRLIARASEQQAEEEERQRRDLARLFEEEDLNA